MCHERVLSGKASCLDLIVPAAARGCHPPRTERVRAVVVLRICVVIRTDARRRRASIGGIDETGLAPSGHRAGDPHSATLSNKAASASPCRCVSPKPRPTNRLPRSETFGRKAVIRLFESARAPGRYVRRGRERCRPSMSRMSGRHDRPRLGRGDQRPARR